MITTDDGDKPKIWRFGKSGDFVHFLELTWN